MRLVEVESNTVSHVRDLTDLMEEGSPHDFKQEEENCYGFEVKGSVCTVRIENTDLAIVNGYYCDPIELKPFDNIFTKQNIWK